MSSLNNKIKIDRFKEGVENALGMQAKKFKEMAATFGFATIYGLLFAGILLAPLPLPSGKVQAQCAEFDPNDCANPCYVAPPPPRYSNAEFDAAASREDCDRILQEVLKKIEQKTTEINENLEAAKACDTTYDEQLTTNDLNHKRAIAQAAKDARDIFWECMGYGGAAGVGAGKTYHWAIGIIRTASVTVVRVGTGVVGGVVSIGVFLACKETRDDTVQSLIDVANKTKEHADKVALMKRDNCREDTNYRNAKRKHYTWHPRRSSSGKGYFPGGRQNAISRANADHAKCLDLFPSGDCGVNE